MSVEPGDYDQAHLIRDCRRLTGMSPARFLATKTQDRQVGRPSCEEQRGFEQQTPVSVAFHTRHVLHSASGRYAFP